MFSLVSRYLRRTRHCNGLGSYVNWIGRSRVQGKSGTEDVWECMPMPSMFIGEKGHLQYPSEQLEEAAKKSQFNMCS